MIATIFRLSWLHLKRDRTALALTFFLPVVFFSIFVTLFGAMDAGKANPINTIVLVEDNGALGKNFADALSKNPELRIIALDGSRVSDSGGRDEALARVRTGIATAAIIIPQGFSDALANGRTPRVEVLADTANVVAVRAIDGLLQAQAFAARMLSVKGLGAAAVDSGPAITGPLGVDVVDVLGTESKRPSVAFFAAGIGVMFLLFSISGRSSILIEERDSGILERLLASQLTMTALLFGHWLFLVLIGFIQVTIMFIWGSIAFGLDLWTPNHLTGFVAMTLVSAAGAAGFGLLLAALCHTRAQLTSIAIIVVLIMSALGGTIVPRFLMPESVQRIGLITFNAWAVDGYQKVFWYEAALSQLWPQLAVLAGLALGFLVTARLLALRWERV